MMISGSLGTLCWRYLPFTERAEEGASKHRACHLKRDFYYELNLTQTLKNFLSISKKMQPNTLEPVSYELPTGSTWLEEKEKAFKARMEAFGFFSR